MAFSAQRFLADQNLIASRDMGKPRCNIYGVAEQSEAAVNIISFGKEHQSRMNARMQTQASKVWRHGIKPEISNQLVEIERCFGRSTAVVLVCFRVTEARQQPVALDLNDYSAVLWYNFLVRATKLLQQDREVFSLHGAREAH